MAICYLFPMMRVICLCGFDDPEAPGFKFLTTSKIVLPDLTSRARRHRTAAHGGIVARSIVRVLSGIHIDVR